MRLPGEADPEFILMRPFTPRQKDNLAAWMVARNDGANYGKLAVYRFPRQSLVFGPNQIVNRINQDTEVSRQITLWDQRGSEVLRGELLVLPIEGSLIYVQPLYLRAQGGRIPELKRVVVAQEGRVAMAETLDAALRALFGESVRRRAEPRRSPARTPAPAAAAAPQRGRCRDGRDGRRPRAPGERALRAGARGAAQRRLGDVRRRDEAARRRAAAARGAAERTAATLTRRGPPLNAPVLCGGAAPSCSRAGSFTRRSRTTAEKRGELLSPGQSVMHPPQRSSPSTPSKSLDRPVVRSLRRARR